MFNGLEQFHTPEEQKPKTEKPEGHVPEGRKKRTLTPDEREGFLDELAQKEKRIQEIKGREAYRRYKTVGTPFEELYKKEQDEIHELGKLEKDAHEIRDGLGMFLGE